MRYVSNTREALLDIARITDQLHRCFEITPEKSDFGISRLSAYLHILHHQCVILATRPLLYTFLETRLHSRHLGQRRYNGVKALLIMCIESAFQNIRILSQLQDEALLGTFSMQRFHSSRLMLRQNVSFHSTLTLHSAQRSSYSWPQQSTHHFSKGITGQQRRHIRFWEK